MLRWIAIVHFVYYIGTGVWPIVYMKSFVAVTGPKTDLWLVKTVGVLVTTVGVSIGVAIIRNNIAELTFALAISACAALGAIDAIYVLKGTISRIYLADAAAEAILI